MRECSDGRITSDDWRLDADIDFLIVGGGIAGLRAAIGWRRRAACSILTKAEPTESNTGYAQGGIAAAIGDDDSAGAARRATRCAPATACATRRRSRVLVEEGPRYVRELIDWGARFDRDADGAPGARPRGGAQRPPRAARRRRHRPRDRPRAVGARRALPSVDDHQSRAGHRTDRRRRRRRAACATSIADGASARGARARRRCWRPAAPGRCFARRPTRRSRPATASRSRITPARASPISSSCSSIRPRSTWPARRGS